MRVNFLTEQLIETISILGKTLPSHSQIPVLTSILLEATKTSFFISSTDLEFGVTAQIPAKIEEEGGVLVPGRQFIEIINTLGREKAAIYLEKDQLILNAQAGTFKFQALPKEEFPKMYEEMGVKTDTFTNEEFRKIFSKLTFAVSTDDARPHLTGVYVGQKEGETHYVATDGYRLSLVRSKKPQEGNLAEGIILSPRLISETLMLKNYETANLYIYEKGNQSIIEAGATKLIGRLIEGRYPDYVRVIPESVGTNITIDREELLKATRSVAVFARENAQVVNLSIANSQVTLSVPATALGEAEVAIDGIQEGVENKIAFNIKFLLDFLKSVEVKKVTIGVNSPFEPSLLTSTEAPDFLHVIMPVKVQD